MNNVTVEVEVKEETLRDLLDSASRGAGYWCINDLGYTSGVNEVFKHGADVTDIEAEPSKKYVLDKESLRKGIEVMTKEDPSALGEILSGDFDDNTGDVFLQYCLFGEIIYG